MFALSESNPKESDDPQLISSQKIMLLIALLAIGLPIALLLFGVWLGYGGSLTSISIYYHTGLRDVLVGTMITVGLLLLCYKGYGKEGHKLINDFYVSRVAGVFAIGVALFPTKSDSVPSAVCGDLKAAGAPEGPPATCLSDPLGSELASYLHLGSAGIFLISLAVFAWFLFTRSKRDPKDFTPTKKLRNRIYKGCAVGIIAMLAWILVLFWMDKKNGTNTPVFWQEAFAVWFFAGSWLVKSRILSFMYTDDGDLKMAA